MMLVLLFLTRTIFAPNIPALPAPVAQTNPLVGIAITGAIIAGLLVCREMENHSQLNAALDEANAELKEVLQKHDDFIRSINGYSKEINRRLDNLDKIIRLRNECLDIEEDEKVFFKSESTLESESYKELQAMLNKLGETLDKQKV